MITAAERDLIIRRASEGVRPALIHAELRWPKSKRDYIYATIKRARDAGLLIQRFPTSPQQPRCAAQHMVRIADPVHLAILDRACRERGLSRSQLLNDLIAAAIDDGLIEAILDDGGEA